MRALCIPMSVNPVKRTRSVGLVSGQGCAQGQEALCRARVRTRSSTPCRNQVMRKLDAEGSLFSSPSSCALRTRCAQGRAQGRGWPGAPPPRRARQLEWAHGASTCDVYWCVLLCTTLYNATAVYTGVCYCGQTSAHKVKDTESAQGLTEDQRTNIRAQGQGH